MPAGAPWHDEWAGNAALTRRLMIGPLAMRKWSIAIRLKENRDRAALPRPRADEASALSGAWPARDAAGGDRPRRDGGGSADRARPAHARRRPGRGRRDGDRLLGARPGRCRDPVLHRLLL